MKNSNLLLIILLTTSFIWKTQAQTILEIFCPADIVVSNDTGNCSALVTFNPATATDVEDSVLTTTQTLGLPSGSAFPVGENIIEFSATDSDANTVTCQFMITVQDTEVPIVVCKQDYEVDLDADGYVTIDPADLLTSVTENCSYIVQGVEVNPCEITNPSNAFEDGSAISNAYTSANDLVAEAGVDFVLNQVTVNLFHGAGTTIPSLDVYYYEDNAGMPGHSNR